MQLSLRRLTFAFGTFGLFQTSPAVAWGPDGHEFIATVARDRLDAHDPALAGTFYDILHGNVLRVTGHNKKTGKFSICQGRDLREIASWPDCIRYLKEYAATGGYHFDDIPKCASTLPPAPPPPRDSYCRNGACASGQLGNFIGTLKDKQATRFERAEALAWVIHIVGDLHQPLHAVDNRDGGGNSVTVRLRAGTIDGTGFSTGKFHGLWDTPMVLAAVGRGVDAVRAVGGIAELHANDASWLDLDPPAWASHAHEIARDAYHALPQEPACNGGTSNGGTIGPDYVNRFIDPVREQLGAASLRLTVILQAALSKG